MAGAASGVALVFCVAFLSGQPDDLAPGPSFGPYPEHVRVCFTCAEPAVVARGVEVLASRIGL